MKNNLIAGALASLFLVSSSYAEKKCFSVSQKVSMINLALGFNDKSKTDKDLAGLTRDAVITKLGTQGIKPLNLNCTFNGYIRTDEKAPTDAKKNFVYAQGHCDGPTKAKAANLGGGNYHHWIDFNFMCKNPGTNNKYNTLADGAAATYENLSKLKGCFTPVDSDGNPKKDTDGNDIEEYTSYEAINKGTEAKPVWTKGSDKANAADHTLYGLAFGDAAQRIRVQTKVTNIDEDSTAVFDIFFVPSDAKYKDFFVEPIVVNHKVSLKECS